MLLVLHLLRPGPVKHYKAMQDWPYRVQEGRFVAIIIVVVQCTLLLCGAQKRPLVVIIIVVGVVNCCCTLVLCGAQKRRLVVISQKHQGCSAPPVGSNRQLIHQYPRRDILLPFNITILISLSTERYCFHNICCNISINRK